jgi:hypothetical protein
MRNLDGDINYSRIIQLYAEAHAFSFASVINPFVSALIFDVTSTKDGVTNAELIDMFGKTVKRMMQDLRAGVTQLSFENTSVLSPGVYILRVEMDGKAIYRTVLKQDR